MKKKNFYLALPVVLFAYCFPAEGQQAKKVSRIGVISVSSGISSFQEGLRNLGYIEGQNLLIEYRNAGGNLGRLPGLVNELVEQQLDLLFLDNQVAIGAAKNATKTIPIVMISSVDPMLAGHEIGRAHV